MTASLVAFTYPAVFEAQEPQAGARAVLKLYCLGCHNEQMKQRGNVPIALDMLDVSNVGGDTKTWEMIVRKMRAGVMPPAGKPRPDKAIHDGFLAWVEGELDRAARANPNPGRTEPIHRLNRTEYQNAVRDLLDLEIDVTSLLPPDDGSYGFDNIAGVLKISPTLMERYLEAARKISRAAVGTAPPFPVIDYFRVADDLAQDDRLPGQLFGTRGGTSIRYNFPMDAYYTIRVQLSRDLNEQVPIYVEPQQLEVSIDSERVQLFTLPGAGAPAPAPPTEPVAAADDIPAPPSPPQRGARAANQGGGGGRQGQEVRNRADKDWEVRIAVKAGVHQVQVAFIKQTSAVAETARLPFLRPYPADVNIAETRTGAYLRSVEIGGPYDPSGPGDSRSRRRIFICHTDDLTCARTILRSLARHAYRRPVTDGDLQPLLAFYQDGRKEGSFDTGIERSLWRLLVSPEFLLRIEMDPADVPPNTAYRINDLQLAFAAVIFPVEQHSR
jgi:hypothetical protein